MILAYIFTSVVLVSLVSLVGALALAIKSKSLNQILIYFVAFSAGALIGDSFLHLLPETAKNGFGLNASVAIFAGIGLFFILEKFLRWRHCHEVDCDIHPNHLGTMNLVGGGVHNFIDGALIASSYLISIPLGITTTLAVLLHEIPHELGDFGVLLHSGYSRKRALLLNFFSASIAVLGAVFAVIFGEKLNSFAEFMIPFTIGGFVYIAMSDLIPELHKEENIKRSFLQFIFVTLGALVMVGLLRLE